MKSNKEILDKFGKTLIDDVFEFNYRLLQKNINKNLESGQLKDKTNSIVKNSIESLLFDFLKIFEEHEEFKLIYEEDDKQVNLAEISEMLKAEPIIENGWIARFSQFAEDGEIE
ncbi:hypothetical protein [uncultured Aquimarina sp.]|uniref:hypothetical protein n=1 Tax=uncultured Aquimarina sp. TaxID=575652 RepID=UPI002621A996|nr:hypothetical protein [uncultured Aquimarina sp.]